jgi:hypothetical protein
MKWFIVFLSLSCGAAFGQTSGSVQQTTDSGQQVDGLRQQADGSRQGAAQVDTAQHWNLLQTDIYSIRYPPDWTANTTGVGGTSFALFAPTAAHKAVFRQNINLVIKDVSADTVTLDELTNVNVEMLKAAFPNFSVISSKRLRDGIGDYQRMIYEFQQQGYYLKQLQEYRIVGAKAYYLTFTSLRSRYEDYMEVVDEVFGSFKFN